MTVAQAKPKDMPAGANLPFIYREYSAERLKLALHKMDLIRQFEEGAEES